VNHPEEEPTGSVASKVTICSLVRLRDVLPPEATDPAVLHFAHEHDYLLMTCNRDDCLKSPRRSLIGSIWLLACGIEIRTVSARTPFREATPSRKIRAAMSCRPY
jgi:hypothetical protein